MASDEVERRWLPRLTRTVRDSVAWFLDILRPQALDAARAAAAGQPAPPWASVPTQQEFDDHLYTEMEPDLTAVFDEAFWQSIDDLATLDDDTATAPDTYEPAPAPTSPARTRDVYTQSESDQRQFYLASVHDRLSQSMWAPDTFDSIRATLMQAVEQGWTLDETTEVLRPLMDPDGTAYDSWIERVAVTELHSAYAGGQYAAALAEGQALGTRPTLRWISTHDDRTRPWHREADQQEVTAGTPFTVGGEELRFPGDPFASPANTIRCRCGIGVFHPSTVTASGDNTMTRYRAHLTVGNNTPDHACGCARTAAAGDEPPAATDTPATGDKPSQGDDGSSSPWDGLHVTITINDQTFDVVYSKDSFEFTNADDPSQNGTIQLDDASQDDGGGEKYTFTWSEDGDGGPTTVKEELDLTEGTVETDVTAPDGTTQNLQGTVTKADGKDNGGSATDDAKSDTKAPAAKKKTPAPDATVTAAALYAVRSVASLTAASLAVAPEWTPPAAHFKPYEGPKRGIQVMDGGRIAGYLATWDGDVGGANCHVGIKSGCTPPPRSSDGLYKYFHQAGTPLTLDDGSKVHPGLLTTDIGHGNQTVSQQARVAHYDQPKAMAAAVVAGEDSTGIWVSGSVLPEVAADPDRMTRLRLARFSGHWEPVAGSLELIAATGVNVPGYQNPSPTGYAVAASGMTEMRTGDVAGEVIRRIDARTVHTAMAERGEQMRARRARSLVASMLVMPRGRTPRPRTVRAAADDSSSDDKEHHGKPSADGGVSLTADDVAFIAELLGVDAGEVQPVELSEDEAAQLLALLDDSEVAEGDEVLQAAHAPARDEVQDAQIVANWVSDVGGLPDFIKRVAKHIQEGGATQSAAIAGAVSQVKKWCAKGNARACTAAASWEAMKAEAKST